MLRELTLSFGAAPQEANSGIWSWVLQKQLPVAGSELCVSNENATHFVPIYSFK